ncbi:MAG TPA: VCBS repeat-containing protein [Pirellulales bacterium]|jgi:hypothetical protein|nr:VCBS repeat-containing protein [Pirellulales bacterium]
MSSPRPSEDIQQTASCRVRRRFAGSLLLFILIALFIIWGVWWNSSKRDGNGKHISSASSTSPNTNVPSKGHSDKKDSDTASGDERSAIKTGVPFSEKLRNIDDPSQDGWDTELFNKTAGAQLKRLGNILKKPDAIAAKHIAAIASDNFTCSSLTPGSLKKIFADDVIEASRWAKPHANDRKLEQTFHGPEGLSRALGELMQPFANANYIRTKFKIFRVEPDANEVTTQQYAEIAGQLDDGWLEQHTTWLARWDNRNKNAPQLLSLKLEDVEQIRTRLPSGTLFSDCTKSALEHNPCYTEQFLRGYMYWLSASQQMRYLVTDNLGTPGLALGDINGDGLDDLYVCQEQGLPNRLFLQQQNGTANEISAAWGVDWLEDSRSALLIDLDNDGDQDLLVAFHGGIIVASNENNQRFELRTIIPSDEHLMSMAAADYDNDGDLDIYATAFLSQWRGKTAAPVPQQPRVYHDGNNGGQNLLLKNNGSWQFEDVTQQAGLDANNKRFSFAASWEDYDNDGDQDLYVANDFGRDNLYRNDDGHFTDVSQEAGAEDAASGMGITWGDFDRDGWFDIHVSNMWSSAGGRIAFQPQFMESAEGNVKQRLQRMARGNTLLKNQANGVFEKASADSGIEFGRWAWASMFADINNDGWDDLLVANGFLTGDQTGDL